MPRAQTTEDAIVPLLEEKTEGTEDFDAFQRSVRETAKLSNKDLWADFEKADQPVLEYVGYGEADAPMINSLLTFITVTTFIAGFAVSDFGSFEAESWSNEAGDLTYSGIAFLVIMSFVSTHNLYLSVLGTIFAASFYRTQNQTRYWDDDCARIVRVIAAGFKTAGGFKGRRREILSDAFHTKLFANKDFVNAVKVLGEVSTGTDYSRRAIMLHSNDNTVWTITFASPTFLMSIRPLFLLREYTFALTIILYVVAQTLKAIQGTSLKSCAFLSPAFLIAGFWMARLVSDLRPVYGKLRD